MMNQDHEQLDGSRDVFDVDGLAFPSPGSHSGGDHTKVDGDEWVEVDEDGAEQEEQPLPAYSWEDATVIVGPADRCRHREVEVQAGPCRYSQRIYFDRKKASSLIAFFGQAAEACFISQVNPPRWVVLNALEEAEAADREADVPQIETTTLADLADESPQQRMRIEDFIPERRICGLFGEEKLNKTGVGLSVGVSGISGRPLFGRFAVPRRFRTLYSYGESDRGEWWSRLRVICESQGVDPLKTRDLVIANRVPRIATTAGMTELRRLIGVNGIRDGLVVLDPASFGVDGVNTGILSSMAPLFSDLAALCGEEGVTVLLVHHTSRTARQRRGRLAPAELGDVTGSGFAEFCRSWVTLAWAKPFDRSGIDHLWMTTGGSDGHAGLWRLTIDHGTQAARRWAVTCEPAADPVVGQEGDHTGKTGRRKPSRLKMDCRRIVSTLRAAPTKTDTARAIRKASGNPPQVRFDAAIDALMKRGRLATSEVVKGGKKHPAFRLVEGS